MPNAMKIIVTGDAGFIGSAIADRYRALGHTVIGVDIRNTKPININTAEQLTALFIKEKPDVINHHAAIVQVIASIREPEITFKTNTGGTLNCLMASGACGTVKKFIFASTCAVYGAPQKIPVPETHAIAPLSPYGLSKRMAEELISYYSRAFNFNYCILRYANAYGPGQNAKGGAGVVALFTELMRNNIQPTIFGDGKKTRDYIFVDDIVRANVAALRRGNNEIVNLGTGREIKDQTVFDSIARALNYTGKPRYAPRRTGEIERIALDNRTALKILQWKPTTTFEKGIQRYIRTIASPEKTKAWMLKTIQK